ncbi:MAG: hypothetical protein WCP07_04950 [bacterium]|jgi:hypothetical protein
MNQTSPIPTFKRAQNVGGILFLLGAIGLGIALISGDTKAFFASFTFGFVFWMTLTLGCCTLVYLHHSIRATWSLSILRIAEAGTKALPLMLVCWLVMAVGMLSRQLYMWSNPANMAGSEVLQRKTWFLNPTTYIVLSLICFAFWILTTWRLNESSRLQDETRDQRLSENRASFAPPAGVIHVVLLTFAITLWVMSLDPYWVSTIYGVWFMIYGLRLVIALGIAVVWGLRNTRPFNELITKKLGADVGNMLLGLTMFWAYVTVSQFLIIWSANLPEEIPFYINRFTGPMVYLGGFLVIAQFFAPFLCLIGMRNKRAPHIFWRIAVWIIIASIIDMFWQITPFFKVGFSSENLLWYALDFAAFAAIGGAWVWVFASDLIKTAQRNALIPLHDTRLVDSFREVAEGHAHA